VGGGLVGLDLDLGFGSCVLDVIGLEVGVFFLGKRALSYQPGVIDTGLGGV
jgi:hypothetical protein